ncbi:MAG TPA: AMP-binding protein [Allosphingosinicella sp.]|jgi:2-aminobenzoate-CoA ligase
MTNTAHVDTFVRDRLPPAEAQPEFLFELPELQYPERLNAAAELMRGGAPDAVAVVNDAGAWTYAEMDALSDRIARLLVEQEKLVPGNRVLLRGPNGAMLFACWLGVLKAGGVVVATMPILRAGEIATILERAEVSHAIVDARCMEDFKPAAAQAGTLRSVLNYAGDAGGGPLEARLKGVAAGFEAVQTHRDDVALIAFTSGTTGKPKGCVHFHRDVLACADAFARHVLRPQAGSRWACSAPIAFTFGLGMLLIFPWRFGGTAVTIEQPGPKALLEAVARFGVTNLATAPTAYKAMLGCIGEHDLSSLTTCVSAGEHLPAATWEAWRAATGLAIVDGIGATEMMHIFISASGGVIRPGATGKAVPGYRACVLDEAGTPLPHGTGRLAVKGPTGCRYFDDPRQAAYVQGGWNVTGDTYRADEDGYFWYVARSDDMIISAGYNIAAPEVENALYAHPAVAECAVIGVPCEERGQRVKAFVVPAEGHAAGEALAKALQEHVKATIAPYKYPRNVVFVDALPKTATGKLQRFALRDAPQPVPPSLSRRETGL